MVNSISINDVRNICDKAGFTSKIDKDGDVQLVLSADDDFGHNVLVFFSIEEADWLRVAGVSTLELKQEQAGKAMMRINEYNSFNRIFKGYLHKDGIIMVERYLNISDGISEDALQKFVENSPAYIWHFFKEKFADF